MRYLIIALLLTGCGVDERKREITSAGCDGQCVWDGNYQERSVNFYVQYSPANPKRPMIEDVDKWWAWLKACTGFDVSIAHAPLAIEYINADTVDSEGRYSGQIWWTLRYARVTQNDVYGGRITRHEMLHYLLHYVGQSNEDNTNHTATYWSTCDVDQV